MLAIRHSEADILQAIFAVSLFDCPLVVQICSGSFEYNSLTGVSMGDFLYHFTGHRCPNVKPRSAHLFERPFTLFVWFLSSLTLLCLSSSLLLSLPLMPFLSAFLSRQLGPYLSACCLVPSCVYWPLAIPQSPSCQLLYPFFHPSPLLSFCMLSKPSTSVSNALSLEAHSPIHLSRSPQELSTLLSFFSFLFLYIWFDLFLSSLSLTSSSCTATFSTFIIIPFPMYIFLHFNAFHYSTYVIIYKHTVAQERYDKQCPCSQRRLHADAAGHYL